MLNFTFIPGEQWRPVVGFEGRYRVSDHGRVYSSERRDSRGHARGGHLMAQTPQRGGYLAVRLRADEVTRLAKVHILVLDAFVGQRPSLDSQCRHLDDTPTNNRLENLCWGTPAENGADKRVSGAAKGSRNPSARINEEIATAIRARLAIGGSKNQIARDFGINPATVRDIDKGRAWVS